MRILKDYNQYVMRNLARGYSRKDLGVSYVKVRRFPDGTYWRVTIWFCGFTDNNISSSYYLQEKQLQVNMKINKLRETVKAHQEKVTVFSWDSLITSVLV